MLVSLDHVTIRSADFERTERFYCELLGMRRGPRPDLAVPGRWLYIGANAVLHVLPRGAGAAVGSAGTIDHFALHAVDLPGIEDKLKAAGYAFERKRLADTDVWQIFLTDPDGARVELCFAGAGAHPVQESPAGASAPQRSSRTRPTQVAGYCAAARAR
jgi:catechol 2,3-dioxygenase-like lactoylglutathione lyase family enzyme